MTRSHLSPASPASLPHQPPVALGIMPDGCFLLGLAAAGCLEGGELENPEEFLGANATIAGGGAGSEDAVERCDALPIFEERCAGGICHSPKDDGSAPGGGTDLTSPGVETRILSQAALTYESVSDPENCPTTPELIVDPANPDGSLLLTKLLGTHSCGDAMPIPNPPTSLNDEEIACVRDWIDGVIANNDGSSGSGGTPAVGTGGASSGGAPAGTGGVSTGGTDPGTGGAATGGMDMGTGGMDMGTGGMDGGMVSMPGDCTSTPQCQMKYAGATDCSNGMGGICLCGSDPCVAP